MKVLFLGDAVTSAGRDVTNESDLGEGYVKITAGKLKLLYPESQLLFVNRGYDGAKTVDLLPHVESDVAKERPDVVVLQVGVNDAKSRFSTEEDVPVEVFRENYKKLVTSLRGTGAKVIVIEPYALKIGDKRRLRPHLETLNANIRMICGEAGISVIPMDEIFMGVTQDIDPSQFSTDGIMPTHRGCRYLADLLIKELKKYIV